MRIAPILTLCAALMAAAANAQEDAGRIALEDQPRWDAVGRITVGGTRGEASCTGTLIASDLVLTAAHCVLAYRNAGPRRIRNLVFVAGWNGDRTAALRSARKVTIDPAYVPGGNGRSNLFYDMAVVHLSTPITDIAPMPLGVMPDAPGLLAIIGYHNGAQVEAPVLRDLCPFQVDNLDNPALVRASCSVVSGNSGSPLMAGAPDSPGIVGVVSAQARPGAFAAVIPPWVFDLIRRPEPR